ncbi:MULTISPECIES: hypothetical protein [Pseudomonas]|uniref:Uncharacterized protein n=1 Tax=Pseudomonas taiwanensis TaxID=470150 RepID=A0ABR6VC27_9PSED|nr:MULTISPECIES: hypothetical protein [Pseudomonas]MBC3478076.1 hypothetical protein [Pseudomonas taiwanensis]MDH0131747.1 hypothetical protein [Pseudomonas asiatica]
MMPSPARSTAVRVLMILGAMMATLLIAWTALQLSAPQLDWFEEARRHTSYFACWRALLYVLIFAGWTTPLRLRPLPEDQQRLIRLGLVGFGSIVLVELSRV